MSLDTEAVTAKTHFGSFARTGGCFRLYYRAPGSREVDWLSHAAAHLTSAQLSSNELDDHNTHGGQEWDRSRNENVSERLCAEVGLASSSDRSQRRSSVRGGSAWAQAVCIATHNQFSWDMRLLVSRQNPRKWGLIPASTFGDRKRHPYRAMESVQPSSPSFRHAWWVDSS